MVGVAGQRTVETGPLPRRVALGSGGGVVALGPKGLVVIEENAVLDIFR